VVELAVEPGIGDATLFADAVGGPRQSGR